MTGGRESFLWWIVSEVC